MIKKIIIGLVNLPYFVQSKQAINLRVNHACPIIFFSGPLAPPHNITHVYDWVYTLIKKKVLDRTKKGLYRLLHKTPTCMHPSMNTIGL